MIEIDLIEIQAAEAGGAVAARAAAQEARDAALVAGQQATVATLAAQAAASDSTQTGLDATATAADRVQTGLDAAATAADRVQTGLDAAATAADRAQTGVDRQTASASATAAAISASTAGTQAGIATTKAGEASASASAAAGSASTAASQASTATTKASEAAASASTASDASTTATTQAGIATTKASEAASSASAASGSAGTASTQAGIATSKATEAAASAAAAASSYDAFDDRYLGSKSTAPTVDNDGQALLVGALYWDTGTGSMRAWSGSAWVDVNELDGRMLADQQLLGAVAYATDMALHLADEVAESRGTTGSTDRAELFAYMFTELIEKIGVVARSISGGTVALHGGTAAIPSLTSATDVTAGVFFPAAGVVALATAALERLRVTADGCLGIGTTTPSGLLDVADNKLRIRTAQTPASAAAAGNQGEIAWDNSYVYVCTATNTWKRAALATW